MSTTALSEATADPATAAAPQPPAPAGVKETLWVMDTTAVPGKGTREHQQIVVEHGHKVTKSYKFQPGEPLELPTVIAMKFLKHYPAFVLTDKEGNLKPYSRQPKQPDELGPNEKFVLGDNQTVASYDELTNFALTQRTMELPGGEALAQCRDRKTLIDFIAKATLEKRRANEERQPGRRAAAPAIEETDDIAPGTDEEMA